MLYHIQNISCHTDIVSLMLCAIFMSSSNGGHIYGCVSKLRATNSIDFINADTLLRVCVCVCTTNSSSSSSSTRSNNLSNLNFNGKFQWKLCIPTKSIYITWFHFAVFFLHIKYGSRQQNEKKVSHSKVSFDAMNSFEMSIDFLNSMLGHLKLCSISFLE